MSDMIAAIATGQNPCAIGIVRISGDGCLNVCDQVFQAVCGKKVADLQARKFYMGDMLDAKKNVIDKGMIVIFHAPHSYTGEDCIELHCHGSLVVLRELLSALFAAGARQAKAGEFTKRAFLNHRMDLTQAEAVADLIDAETIMAARNAAAQLDGGLRRVLEPVQDGLLEIASRFYAVVDYPDEDIEDIKPEEIIKILDNNIKILKNLLSSSERGRILKSGVRTVLTGRPNAGKSSLLNLLTGFDRAIVTDIPGTTRDTVEESAICGGILLRLIDTAGLRETRDKIEQLGVERTRKAIDNADLILVILDQSADFNQDDFDVINLAARSGKPWILIQNKIDIINQDLNKNLINQNLNFNLTDKSRNNINNIIPENVRDNIIYLSAKTGEGLENLEKAIKNLFPADKTDRPGTFLTDIRQEDAARRAADALKRANHAILSGLTPDAALTDIEYALDALGELTGRSAKEEIISRIFSRFCVGK